MKSPSAPGWPRARLVSLGLLALIWIVFGQTLHFGFVNYDDNRYVYDQPAINRGFTAAGLAQAFTRPLVENWHPLTSMSLMLDAQIFGEHAIGYHLTNLLLHSATVLALFFLLRRLTGAFWRSAIVAALFAIHPLHVESVAWISERKDVLSGFFFVLTLGAYEIYARKPSVLRYLAVFVLLALGLMSKAMLVTVPCLLLLLDYWPLARHRRQNWIRLAAEKLPLLLLVFVICAVTVFAQKPALTSVEQLPFLWRANNAVVSYLTYLWQIVWPARLAVFYPHPENRLALWQVSGAGLFLALVSLIAFLWRKRRPYFLVGWLWFLGMLVPVIGLVQVGMQAHADRYAYLPSIGLFVAIVWSIGQMLDGKSVLRTVVEWISVVLLGVLTLQARRQTSVWQNSESLWRHTLAVTAPSSIAHQALGEILLEKNRLAEATNEFQAALRLNPNSAYARNDLGVAFFKAGDLSGAIDMLRSAVQLNPSHPTVHFNLGNVYLDRGDLAAAIAEFQEQIRSHPDDASAHFNLANTYLRQEHFSPAIAEYETALRLKPNDASIHNNFAAALLRAGRTVDAETEWKRSLQLRPGNLDARNNLGVLLVQRGQFAEAIAQWEEALRLEPDNATAQSNLAWVLATTPDRPQRNGALAVQLIAHSIARAGQTNPGLLRIQAAAQAAAGDFAQATVTAQAGFDLAQRNNLPEMAGAIQRDLIHYRANQPLPGPD